VELVYTDNYNYEQVFAFYSEEEQICNGVVVQRVLNSTDAVDKMQQTVM
jgi:hypothetical protein